MTPTVNVNEHTTKLIQICYIFCTTDYQKRNIYENKFINSFA